MKSFRTSLALLLLAGAPLLLAMGDDSGSTETDPFADACASACESFGACEGQITTLFPIYFDQDTCVAEFCDADDVIVDPNGRGTADCDEALEAYVDCISNLTCQEWDDSDVVSNFAGANQDACDDESNDFVLICLAFAP